MVDNNDEVFNTHFKNYKSKIITLLEHPETMKYIRFAERRDYETDSYELKITVPRMLARKISDLNKY